MDYKDYSTLSLSEISKTTETIFDIGLSSSEADKRIATFGLNKIKSSETTGWAIFIRQFKSPFTYLLFGASIISAALGEVVDGGMIFLFVFLNSCLSFYQEYRSEQTVRLLKKYLASKIRVIREGKEEIIETSLIVPGDIIVFEPGDIIPADCRFIEDHNLIVDEEVLTGESVPISKTSGELKNKASDIYNAGNIGFSGTTVVSGRGKAVVIATGENTNYATIVKLASTTERVSSFEKELSKFSKFTLWVVLATLIFIIVTSIAVKESPSLTDLLLFSIALSVSVIPETLPAVMTFCLSIGARNLTKKGVVVKRLTSVEDLGALQVLATDKTGTLTLNKLQVANSDTKDSESTLLYAALASFFVDSTRNAQNNAFDIALQNSLDKDVLKTFSAYKKIGEIPFDPGRKRVTTLLTYKGKNILISRGTPEEILKLCGTSNISENVMNWVSEEGRQGRRSLAVAIKLLKNKNIKNLSRMESGMKYLGSVSFTDPIKESAYTAVVKAKALGVQVKIITGDSAEVAGAVAKEIGLIQNSIEVITGSDFQELDSVAKHEAVKKYTVFARIVPEQKHEIITLLKETSYVGFLGEGINDAPALKAANVAIVVEGASDVAKESADIVLMQKDLEVIMNGIEEGRKVFANTSKYITATMASNFGNFFAIALITPFINFLPMLPLQILLIDLLSDFPLIMIATDNVDREQIAKPRQYNIKSFAVSALSFGFISTAFDFSIFSYFVKMGPENLHTYWFIESILSELLIIFTVRSIKPFFKAAPPSKSIIYLTILTIAVTITIPFIPIFRQVFGFIVPSTKGIMVVAAIVTTYLLTNEAAKGILRRYRKSF